MFSVALPSGLSLLGRMATEVSTGAAPPPSTQACRGPMFDAIHYLTAIEPEAAPQSEYEPPF